MEWAIGSTCTTVFSEVFTIIQALHDAAEWGNKLKDIGENSQARVYSKDCLYNLSYRENLQLAGELLQIFKDMMQDLIPLVENNDGEGYRTIIQNMSTIILGNDINSINPVDYKIDISQWSENSVDQYCLLFVLCLEYAQIISDWENNWAPCFSDEATLSAADLQDYEALKIDKKQTTKEAMKIYKPIIENLLHIASIPANALLIGNE